MMKSWKTTLAGIISFFMFAGPEFLALLDDVPTTQPDWTIIVAAFSTLIGLLFARDNDVPSEKVLTVDQLNDAAELQARA